MASNVRPKVFRAINSRCSGCSMCELVCSLNKTGTVSPSLARIKVMFSESDFTFRPIICRHCTNAPCEAACPVSGAMVQDANTGAWAIDEAHCIACLACVEACPFGAIRVGPNREILKCDLCGGDPLCVQHCPPRPLPPPEQSSLQYVEPHTVVVGQRAALLATKK